jgi:hypothetical protein
MQDLLMKKINAALIGPLDCAAMMLAAGRFEVPRRLPMDAVNPPAVQLQKQPFDVQGA